MISAIEPANARYWVSFRQGGRHPIDRGAAGYALLAARPSQQGEAETVAATRVDGYVISYGEVEPGFWGLGVPLDRPVHEPPACVVLISASEELVRRLVPDMLDAAAELSKYNG